MKQWFLVLFTAALPFFTMSASAATVFPPELFRFITSSQPSEPEPEAPNDNINVAGPEFPNNGISPYRQRLLEILAGQRTNGGSSEDPAIIVSPPAAVPLPAAGWLMDTALIALAGIARRKRA